VSGPARKLEQRYRRLLTLYPGAFRAEYEGEMLAVILDAADGGSSRPGLRATLDLVRGALVVRTRASLPRSPRSIAVAVRLMYLGAGLELLALGAVVLSAASVRLTLLRHQPGLTARDWHGVVQGQLLPTAVGAGVAAVVLVLLAWANGRGHRSGRVALACLFALDSAGLVAGLARGSATYAPLDLLAGAAVWLCALIVLLLVFSGSSATHYRRARQWPAASPSS